MKQLNLKNMIETYINYSADQVEMDKIYSSFYEMACVGFIDRTTWAKFEKITFGWYIWSDLTMICVRDSYQDDGIIWEYNPDTVYHFKKGGKKC